MAAEHPTREAPWIEPVTGVLVWREKDPASGVVMWFWKDPETQAVTEMIDGDTLPAEKLPSARGRPGPTTEEIRKRIMSEGILRARVGEGHRVENAALLAAGTLAPYDPPESLTPAAYANDPGIRNARDAERRVADLIRTRHYREFGKILPAVIPDPVWTAAERVFGIARIAAPQRSLSRVLDEVLVEFEGGDRDVVEQNADRVLGYARDLLRAVGVDAS